MGTAPANSTQNWTQNKALAVVSSAAAAAPLWGRIETIIPPVQWPQNEFYVCMLARALVEAEPAYRLLGWWVWDVVLRGGGCGCG